MSAALIPPGTLLRGVTTLADIAKRGLFVAEMPPRDATALTTLVDGIRAHMSRDCHVGPLLEGAVDRIAARIADGNLGGISSMDLRTVGNFLKVVPTTRRSA
jgi:hypothetical protein